MKLRMDLEQAEEWRKRTSAESYIAEEVFFRHSDLFLKNYDQIKEAVNAALNSNINKQEFGFQKKKLKKETYYKRRIKAKPLNEAIRVNFKRSSLDFKYEVTFSDGVFDYSPKTEGFDFAYYDDRYNLVNFRNLCFGYRPLYNGKKIWETKLKGETYWSDLIKDNQWNNVEGQDIEIKKLIPTVLGEIQFGNWGLVYRDILKVIQIERHIDVDLFIYITATGNLSDAISDSTVSYRKTKSIFEEYKGVLNVPIWLIGLDIK